jgi:thioredoxin-like negative regulator of GroEL
VEKLATKHADNFSIAKVIVYQNPELAQQFGVRSIPALFFIQDGTVQESLVGVQTETALEKKIEQYTVTA